MPKRPPPARVETVHVVFKTHLDVGFTDFAARVVDRYVHGFLPAALDLADALRARGGDERFVWTVGSWLVHTALERTRGAARRRLEAAVVRGDVVWHALPMTFHSELLDASLAAEALAISRRLDARFGRRTVAAKMTDVPGHTRALVPLLAGAGVELLHLGVNRASSVPKVPPVFRWCAPQGSEVTVIQGSGYGAGVRVPGLRDALFVSHTEDNVGPPRSEDVLRLFARLRAAHPGASVVASSLDAFARALRPVRARLPVVTAEIGDTWIHGAASDPWKLAAFRALARLRAGWLATGRARAEAPPIRRMGEALLQVAEHTWGLDAKTHLRDFSHWDATSFRRVRGAPAFRKMERSWREQRGYVRAAVRALGRTARAREAHAALREITPRAPARCTAPSVAPRGPHALGPLTLAVDARSGALVGLRDGRTGRVWADAAHPLAWLRYQTFSAGDVARWLEAYTVNRDDPAVTAWSVPDFGKPGLETARPEGRFFAPRLASLHRVGRGDAARLLARLEAPARAHARYGCPRHFELEVRAGEDGLDLALRWWEKPATRLPEALWLGFVPRLPRGARWWIDKLGERLDPSDVVSRGARGLHGVGSGVGLVHPRHRFAIRSLDAALVAPGGPSLLRFDDAPPRASGGMHFLLHDNVWGTNFPLWYEDAASFRFTLSFPNAP